MNIVIGDEDVERRTVLVTLRDVPTRGAVDYNNIHTGPYCAQPVVAAAIIVGVHCAPAGLSIQTGEQKRKRKKKSLRRAVVIFRAVRRERLCYVVSRDARRVVVSLRNRYSGRIRIARDISEDYIRVL